MSVLYVFILNTSETSRYILNNHWYRFSDLLVSLQFKAGLQGYNHIPYCNGILYSLASLSHETFLRYLTVSKISNIILHIVLLTPELTSIVSSMSDFSHQYCLVVRQTRTHSSAGKAEFQPRCTKFIFKKCCLYVTQDPGVQ